MGISDCNLTEELKSNSNHACFCLHFEDINWNTFTTSDDHIVLHRADGFSDEYSLRHNCKKPRYEVYYNVGMIGTDKYFATKPAVHGNYGISNNPPMQHTSSSNLLVPPLCYLKKRVKRKIMDNISVSNTDPKSMILESTQESNVQFDWPDLSNFEGIDKVFGNWDSTIDQQQTACINELPWFSSSSDTNCGSEITFDKDYQSSRSNLVASHDIYESSNLNSDMHENVSTISNFDKPVPSNHAPWSGTNDLTKDKFTYKEKLESQQSSNDKRTEPGDQILFNSEVSASKNYSSENTSQQKQFIGSSSYIPISEPTLQESI